MRRKPKPTRTALLAAVAALAVLALAIPALAHDGEGDGRFGDAAAGTIASFDEGSGVLTIDLTEGGSTSGLVTRSTWIGDRGHGGSCEDGDRDRRRHARTWCRHGDRGRHHGRGDTSDLLAGAAVDDAVLVLDDGRAFFAKVDLDD